MPREEPSAPVEMVRPIQVQIELKPNPVSFSVSESEPRLEYDPRRDQGFGFSRGKQRIPANRKGWKPLGVLRATSSRHVGIQAGL